MQALGGDLAGIEVVVETEGDYVDQWRIDLDEDATLLRYDSGNGLVFAFQTQDSDEVQVAFGLLPAGFSAISRLLLGFDTAVPVPVESG